MSKPKVAIYTPMGSADRKFSQPEEAGCELCWSDPEWRRAFGANEEKVFAITEGRAAIVGAVMRGHDDIDIDAATVLGILVTHSPTEADWGGVAEGTMATMLTPLKKVRERDQYVRNGGWRDDSLAGTYLGARQDGYEGITVGILGLGRIGARLCDLLAPRRFKLIACDPYVDEAKFTRSNAKAFDLETLLRESDVVTIHSNLTSETHHLMNEARFEQMKPTAILINAARGPIVEEEALFFALEKQKIASAALDIFETEPLDLQSPLRGLGDKILVSPHMISGNKGASLKPAVPWTVDNTLAALRGELPRHIVNTEAVPLWRERFGGKSLL